MYFTYTHYPFVRPAELDGAAVRHAVAVVGGGPVGLTAALALARFGVRAVVIEPRDCVSHGSRATCISRRSLEVLDRVGPGPAITAKGVWWHSGRTYFRDRQVFALEAPHSNEDRHPPFLNMQQCAFEQFLVDACHANPAVEIRWHSRVAAIAAGEDGVALTVETPAGSYRLDADWVVAADGAHSTVREALGLRFEGTSYEGRYLISDIELDTDTPAERRVWFDPPSNPGSTIIMHCQPDNIWRFDSQLRPDEDDEQELEDDRLKARIRRHLDFIGERGRWSLVWSSLYRAHCLTLPAYRAGRVLFAGDAAHLVPIFGVRGLNSGIEDTLNLGWKLAFVVRGLAPEALLDSYSGERHAATVENHFQATKSTWFMTPPGPGFTLMRDAVLSLATAEPRVRGLINPRQTSPFVYAGSELNTADGAAAGLALGEVLPNLRVDVRRNGKAADGHLLELAGDGFLGLQFAPAGDEAVDALGMEAARAPVPVTLVRVGDGAQRGAAIAVRDGEIAGRLGARAGELMLFRPDDHLCARLVAPTGPALCRAVLRALGRAPTTG